MKLFKIVRRVMKAFVTGNHPVSLARRGRGTSYRLRVDELESRFAPATFTWTGAAGTTDWLTPRNWSHTSDTTAGVPSATDNAVISGTGLSISGDAAFVGNLTINGDVTLLDALFITNTLTVNGTFRLGSINTTAGAVVNFDGVSGTITGSGAIDAYGNSTAYGSALYASTGNLTITKSITIVPKNSPTHQFLVGSELGTFYNQGTIEVNGGEVVLQGDMVNQGTLSCENGGTLDFTFVHTWSTSTIISNTGTGTVHLSGTLSNGSTPAVISGNGTWLAGLTVKDTTLDCENGAKLSALGTLTLDGATINGDAQVTPTNFGGAHVVIRNNCTINGTFTLGDDSGSGQGEIYFDGVETLGGNATIVFGDSSKLQFPNGLQIGYGSPTVLTIASTVTIRGKDGALFGGGDSVINEGTISADVAGGTITLSGLSLQNTGTIQAKNGGFIEADYSHVSIYSAFYPSVLSNFSNGTLTGGTWQVYDNSSIHLPITDITTNAANILFDGPNAQLLQSNNANALSNLATNSAGATLTVQDGKTVTVNAVFTNAGTVSIGNNAVFTTAVPMYASSVIDFSSQYIYYGSGSANAALGTPDNRPWLPSSENGTQEFLTLGFSQPGYARQVDIREDVGNGFVTRVDLLDTAGIYHTVWTGTDPTPDGKPADFIIRVPTTSYLVRGVKVYVNTNQTPGYEGIDSVGLYTDQVTYQQTGGSTTLGGGTLNAIGSVALSGGTLSGTGTVSGARLTNGAQIDPGSPYGSLSINGDYIQTAAGSLNIVLGGSSSSGQFDALQVSGNISLGGTLNISEPGGYLPQIGDVYRILTFASRSGDFASITGLTLSNGLQLAPTYDSGGLDLTVTNPVTDVSSQVTVRRSGFRYDHATHLYLQTLTFTNTGSAPITGPLSVALTNLRNATLFNRKGTTSAFAAGSPFLDIDLGSSGILAAGQSVSVTLEFADPSNLGITYGTTILAGNGTR